jgi:hypothetical protein
VDPHRRGDHRRGKDDHNHVVSGGTVYTIANQHENDLAVHAGQTVKLTGDIQGTTVTVSKIAASAKKTKTKT